jgi:hypothetical protein
VLGNLHLGGGSLLGGHHGNIGGSFLGHFGVLSWRTDCPVSPA